MMGHCSSLCFAIAPSLEIPLSWSYSAEDEQVLTTLLMMLGIPVNMKAHARSPLAGPALHLARFSSLGATAWSPERDGGGESPLEVGTESLLMAWL